MPGHATNPAFARPPDQPDRRRRGGRTAGIGAQGTDREQPGRRRQPHRRAAGRRRRAADPRRRRRRRHRPGRPAAGPGPPCHQQDRQPGRSGTGRQLRLSRRGAGLDRLGGAGRADQPTPAARPCLARARRERARTSRAGEWHGGRGGRSVLQHAGAAQVPEDRGDRVCPLRRRLAPHGAGPAGRRLQPRAQPQRPGVACRSPASPGG